MTTASICTIGDEILIGQIVDTNSSKISRELNNIGVKVRYMVSIGDDHREIVTQLRKCLNETNIVIVTGGLGPTKDDITKEALKELTGATGYKESSEQMENIVRILNARGIPMIDTNRAQALVPDTCTVIPNKLGTAPCMSFHLGGYNGSSRPSGSGTSSRSGGSSQLSGGGSVLYSLPGVPFEAIGLLPEIIADIKQYFNLEHITHHTIVTFGIPESTLAKRIESLEDSLPENIKLAYLPNPTIGVRLRLSQFGGNSDFSRQIAELQSIIGDAIYGEGDDNLQTVIGRMLREMGRRHAAGQNAIVGVPYTLSVAESCTGGHISELITSVPGCSDYYKGSVTSYANEVKINVLKVPSEVISSHGAVSEECVKAMAEGVLKALDTDFSVATSGIAGPGGGSPEKPVGMAWLAAAYRPRGTSNIIITTQKVGFASSRSVNIERFASYALNLLRLHILRQLR